MDEAVRKYLSKLGKQGGKSRSAEKIEAVRANLEIAQEARRKYPRCPAYKNHSHRFSEKTNKCYGCGYKRKVL
jgi:hypothetical protein